MAFGALMMLLTPVVDLAMGWVFSPAASLAMWQADPVPVVVAPLVSQFAAAGLFGAAFNTILLLAAGRHVERAVGPGGVVTLFVAGAYAGALARLALTPLSITPGFGAAGSVFAAIGAYLMLYGIPAGVPITLRGSRLVQVAALGLIWAALQFVFLLASAGGDISVAIVEPLGGLAAGALLARPLLRWRYRKA